MPVQPGKKLVGKVRARSDCKNDPASLGSQKPDRIARLSGIRTAHVFTMRLLFGAKGSRPNRTYQSPQQAGIPVPALVLATQRNGAVVIDLMGENF